MTCRNKASIRAAIQTLTPAPKKKKNRRRDYSHIDPDDIDPETGAPYDNYETPCIDPHPFGGGIKAGDY